MALGRAAGASSWASGRGWTVRLLRPGAAPRRSLSVAGVGGCRGLGAAGLLVGRRPQRLSASTSAAGGSSADAAPRRRRPHPLRSGLAVASGVGSTSAAGPLAASATGSSRERAPRRPAAASASSATVGLDLLGGRLDLSAHRRLGRLGLLAGRALRLLLCGASAPALGRARALPALPEAASVVAAASASPRRRGSRRSSRVFFSSATGYFLTLVADGQDAGDLALGEPQARAVLERAGRGLEAQVEELLPDLLEVLRQLGVGSDLAAGARSPIQRDPPPASRSSSSPTAWCPRGGAPPWRAARERRPART